jgi:uncharacterized protein YciI
MSWTTIDGRSWKFTSGLYTALVWLHIDEKTYHTNVYADDEILFPGPFDCLKKAKSACLEAIRDAEDLADAEKLMKEDDCVERVWRESDPTIDDGMPA